MRLEFCQGGVQVLFGGAGFRDEAGLFHEERALRQFFRDLAGIGDGEQDGAGLVDRDVVATVGRLVVGRAGGEAAERVGYLGRGWWRRGRRIRSSGRRLAGGSVWRLWGGGGAG